MLETAWLFIGGIAFIWTLVTVAGAVIVSLEGADPNTGDGLATVGGVVGFVLWGVWTFGALNITIITETGATETFAEPSLALVGIAMALVPGYIALTGPIELIRRAQGTTPEEI